MNRDEFFKKISEDYFQSNDMEFDRFKQTVAGVMPVFGELKVEVVPDGEETKLLFHDIDKANLVIAEEGFEPTEEDLDMSGVIMILTLDKDGVIIIVDHNMSIFTKANKDIVLFTGFLIGKKICNIN